MAQITINIQTMDWTMGETVGLHLMLKKGSKARIAWRMPLSDLMDVACSR